MSTDIPSTAVSSPPPAATGSLAAQPTSVSPAGDATETETSHGSGPEPAHVDPSLAALRSDVRVDRGVFEAVFEQSLCILQSVSANQPDPERCDDLLRD